ATLREKYFEAHDLILKAWKEDKVFSFNGKFTKLRYVNLWPKPVQKPHPPIWIPGGGSIETWQWCAKMDYVYAYLSYFGYKAGKKVSDGYWNAMAKKGKPLNPYSLGFAQVVAVSETDEQAERDYAPHMDYFYNRCLHVYNGFADAPGYRTLSTIKAGLLGQVGARASLRREGLQWKDFLDEGYVIAGSPATVRDRLREAMKSLNCGHMMILMQIGSMPPELVRKSTELFAREVMPHMRGMWPDWEDKWSPRPMAESERAVPAPVGSERRAANGKVAARKARGNGHEARSGK
ncbi:MAG TPA: LLM class flavin-dependent oxidoreductase, partial [Candidatus Binataceae bacterium]|nr:LLM class flavin-dependent oxidoreductase [Candidatus Binataceae bacterium]